MDTNIDDIDQLEQAAVIKLLCSLLEHKEKLEGRIVSFISELETDMIDLQPEMSGLISKEALAALARKFRDAHDEHMDRLNIESEAILQKIQLLLSLYDRIGKRFDALKELEDEFGKSELEFFGNQSKKQIKKTEIVRNEFLARETERKRGTWLQSGLLKLIEYQDDETKKWFMKEAMRQFGDHFRPSDSTRPVVQLGPGTVYDGDRLELPVEIKEMIFAIADLETCVELREVSKDWYSAFHNSEHTMKSNLKERNPWISPGDPDLQTWADCVLVFVRRLQNPKWMAVLSGEVDKIEIPAQPLRRKTVVAAQLDLEETLPAEFVSLYDKPIQLNVRTYPQSVEYHIDPYTLRTRKALVPYTEVRADEHGTLINYEGIEITLDPWYEYEDICDFFYHIRDAWPVEVGSHSVRVFFNDRTALVAPRDKPHFEHGMILDAVGHGIFKTFTEVGDVLVHTVELEQYHHAYDLVDLDSSLTAPISELVPPVASFNGLIWCKLSKGLLPTFTDLQNPGTTYYRADRAIYGVIDTQKFKQCSKSKGLGQFLYLDEYDPAVVDLTSGVQTTLVGPPGWSHAQTFVIGLLDGVFQARCLNHAVWRTYYDRLLVEHGLPPVEE